MNAHLDGRTFFTLSDVSNPVKYQSSLHSESSRELCQVDARLAALIAVPNWVGWRYESVPGASKRKKPPFDPGRSTKHPRRASATNPRTWGSHAQAVAFAKAAKMDGLGFVLTAELGLTLVDLDDCFDDAGNIEPWAAEIVEALNSYTELSPSGKGLHVLAWGRVAALKSERVEIYGDQRYTTITGRPYGPVRAIADGQSTLERIRLEYAPATHTPVECLVVPQSIAPVDRDDVSVISKLQSSPKYGPLWAGNATGDLSRADFSLCNGIVWFAGPDQERVERIFRQSGLYRPEKHDCNSGGGHTNLSVTVFNAIRTRRGKPYEWPVAKPSPATPAPDPRREPTLTEKLRILQLWLRYFLAGRVGARAFKNTLAVSNAIIEVAIERQRIDGLAVGQETIRALAGVRSRTTVKNAISRVPWLLEIGIAGDKINHADQYDINPAAIEMANEWAISHPEIPVCAKLTSGKTTPKNHCQFRTNGGLFSDYTSNNVFSTGVCGIARALGLTQPGAGKSALLAIDVLKREKMPTSAKQYADLVGISVWSASRDLKLAYDAGLLEREREMDGLLARRFFYHVPDDIDQRIVLAGLRMSTLGIGAELAREGAAGLVAHAERLCPELKTVPSLNERPPLPLDVAQKSTLAVWHRAADLKRRGLDQVIDLATRLDRSYIEKIAGSAVGDDLNRRALQAARQFKSTILVGEETVLQMAIDRETDSDKQEILERVLGQLETIKEAVFKHWSSVAGYSDLARRSRRKLVSVALRTVHTTKLPSALQPPAPRAPRVTLAELSERRHLEPLQATAIEHGFTLSVAAHTVSRAEP